MNLHNETINFFRIYTVKLSISLDSYDCLAPLEKQPWPCPFDATVIKLVITMIISSQISAQGYTSWNVSQIIKTITMTINYVTSMLAFTLLRC